MGKKFDFIISGGGLVGCILASELSKLNFKCCIIEKNKFELSRKSNNINPLSLNYRSRIILEKLKLWNLFKSECNPISELTLKHFNNLSRVKFQSKDFEAILEEHDGLTEKLYEEICNVLILKYDTSALGLDDVVETDKPVDDIEEL